MPLHHNLNHFNQVNILVLYFSKIYFNIICPYELSASSVEVYAPNFFMHFSFRLHVLHVPLIVPFWI